MGVNALKLPFSEVDGVQAEVGFRWFETRRNPAAWNQLLAYGPQRLFNLSEMLAAHAQGGSYSRGIIFQQPDGRRIAMGALLNERQSRPSLEMLAFPALATTGDPDLLIALSAWLSMQQITDIQIGSFTGGVEGYRLPEQGLTSRNRLEFEWNLRDAPEQRFRSLRSNHKRKLRRLLKEELELRKVERYQAEQLTRLRLEWGRRRSMPTGFRHTVGMYLYYRFLHRNLTQTGIANLYGLYNRSGKLLSLAYMLESDDVAFYMIGASSEEGYRLNASLRLFWDLSKYYSDRGYQFLNLGGVPADAAIEGHAEHGVFRFKTGFGCEPITRTSLSIATWGT